MKKGDISTIIGIAGGFAALVVAFIIEGGRVMALFQLTAAIIIFGGTIAATLTSFSLEDIMKIPALIMESMQRPGMKTDDLIETIVTFAEKARREGILVLENEIEEVGQKYDPLFQKGLKFIVDGTDPEVVKNVLFLEVEIFEQHKGHNAEIFEQAGGYSPTMGIIGTVMGLVSVLNNLSGGAEHLGSSIALAFIATLYGISFANLFWLPISHKLKLNTRSMIMHKRLIIEGLLSIQQGDNPSILRDKLDSFLTEDERIKFKKTREMIQKE